MKERHIGIDFLRILSMFLVLVLHILGQGGVIAALDPASAKYKAVWLLEIFAYCSVNCYALVTGYVSVDSKFRYSRIIVLWLQVVFYTVLITLCFKTFMPNALWSGVLTAALMPVTKVQYWYFTAYFGMFFFIPYINILIAALKKPQFKALVFALVLLFSVIPTFAQADLFSISGGYSMLWLVVLYFIGAYIKLYGSGMSGGKLRYFLGFLFFILVCWCSKFIRTGIKYNPDMFIGYTSPLIVGAAVCLFIFCSKISSVGRLPAYLISTFTFSSFGVYLIHTNPLVWQLLLTKRFASFASLGVFALIAAVLGTSLAVYLACSLVDILRSALFRLLRINKIAEALEKSAGRALKALFSAEKELSGRN